MSGIRENSAEYRLHEKVAQLLQALGLTVTENEDLADDYVRKLEDSKSGRSEADSQAAVPSTLQELQSSSRHSDQFSALAETLRVQKPQDFRNVIFLLSELKKDAPLTEWLKCHAGDRAKEHGRSLKRVEDIVAGLKETSRGLTSDDAAKVVNQLSQASKIPSNIPTGEQQAEDLRARKAALRVASLQLPEEPDWLKSRAYLSDCLIASNQPVEINCRGKSISEQEELIIEDLLYLFMGIEGEYIIASRTSGALSFSINSTLDNSLREQCTRIVQLALYVDTIQTFIEERQRYQYGLVSQAFCAALSSLMEVYRSNVIIMEEQHRKGQLSLQKLWFFIQPLMDKMKMLALMCNEVVKADIIGGRLLTFLEASTTTYANDKEAEEIVIDILKHCSVPYFKMIHRWIFQGIIYDPYKEFMITVNDRRGHRRKKSDAGQQQTTNIPYTLAANDCIPSFLLSEAASILKCGQYLNILISCVLQQVCLNLVPMMVFLQSYKATLVKTSCRRLDKDFAQGQSSIEYDHVNKSYVQIIRNAYHCASGELLRIFVCEFRLNQHISSFKHFFLIDQGDFLLAFLETAEEELSKPLDNIMLHRVQNLLELALRTSSLGQDSNKDQLKVTLASKTLTGTLLRIVGDSPASSSTWRHRSARSPSFASCASGGTSDTTQEAVFDSESVQALCLRLDVPWPLSIVFPRKILEQYSMIFRRLLRCKWIELQVTNHWRQERHCSRSLCLLRYKVLHFLQNYLYYATAEVIEPNWISFKQAIEKAKTVEDILREHNTFLDECTKDCMLTNSDMIKTINDILTLCCEFANRHKDAMALIAEFEGYIRNLLDHIRTMGASRDSRCWHSLQSRLENITERRV